MCGGLLSPMPRALPHEHALQQLLVALGVTRPVLLHIFVHAVLQCACTVLGVHTGHLQDTQFSLTVTADPAKVVSIQGAAGLHRVVVAPMLAHFRFPALEPVKAQPVFWMRHSMSFLCTQSRTAPSLSDGGHQPGLGLSVSLLHRAVSSQTVS